MTKATSKEALGRKPQKADPYLEGLPRFNVGAFFLPPIWGPVHGIWASILYYPAWLFMDNMLYAAYADPSALHAVLAASIIAVYIVITAAFSVYSQRYAAKRAESGGIPRDVYIKRQRIWAVVCVVAGLAMIAFASYYNVFMRADVRGY